MPIPKKELSYLLDIYACCKNVIEFTRGIRYYQYSKDKMRKSAVERQLEIVGEASNRLSKSTQSELNHIPWSEIIGLRNMIAHEYDEVKHEKIWRISKKHIPALLRDLKKIKELKVYLKMQEEE